MKRTALALFAAASFSGCVSVTSARVAGSEVVASGGEAVEVIQADVLGMTMFFNQLVLRPADLDEVVNKILVVEAKSAGAAKVQLLSAHVSPQHGIFNLPAILFGFPTATATGIAVVPAR